MNRVSNSSAARADGLDIGGDDVASPAAAGRSSSRRVRGADKPAADGQPSARRVAANRANAARSTGPRTEQGKRVARYNALRHGLAAQSGLLPGEDADDLLELTADVEADHGGSSAAERIVAGRLVAIAWKLRRLARAEEEMAYTRSMGKVMMWAFRQKGKPMPAPGHEFDGPDPMPMPDEAPRIVADDLDAGGKLGARLERLGMWELKLGGQLMAVCRQLVSLRKAMAENVGEAERMPTAGAALDLGPVGEEEDEAAARSGAEDDAGVVVDEPVGAPNAGMACSAGTGDEGESPAPRAMPAFDGTSADVEICSGRSDAEAASDGDPGPAAVGGAPTAPAAQNEPIDPTEDVAGCGAGRVDDGGRDERLSREVAAVSDDPCGAERTHCSAGTSGAGRLGKVGTTELKTGPEPVGAS